ncbi:serine/threonine protein kinase [Patescibacteria group bacterium]
MTDNDVVLNEDMRVLLEQSQEEGDTLVTGVPLGCGDVVIYKIASCGQGTVYMAYNPVLERKTAVKFIIRDEEQSDVGWAEQLSRFGREAKILAKLNNQNIPKVVMHDNGEGGNLPPYMVMEYIEGNPLRSVIESATPMQRRSLEWQLKRLRYFPDVCDALAIVHLQDLIHRDIKPDNLMVTVTADGRVIIMLIDFGIALYGGHSRQTQEGLAVGTIGYLSPEQARGQEITKLADVYSLGAVLFEILHYEPYVESQYHFSAVEGLLKACQPDYFHERMSQLYAEAQAFERLAMAPEPEHRFRDMYQLKGALKVLIRQLEYMHAEGVTRCPHEVSQNILLSEALGTPEFVGAVRMLAKQYELMDEAGYAELPAAPQVSSSYPSISQPALSRRSGQSLRETTPAPDFYEQAFEPEPKKRTALFLIGIAVLLCVLAGASIALFLKSKKQPTPRSPPQAVQTDAGLYVVKISAVPDAGVEDAFVQTDAASLPDASPSKPDASVPTPAQTAEKLFTEREAWCRAHDKKTKASPRMWTFPLSCHIKYVRVVRKADSKLEVTLLLAKRIYKRYCTNSKRRTGSEPPLDGECDMLVAAFKRALERIYHIDREVYNVHFKWSPYHVYLRKQKKRRREKRRSK